MSPTTGPHGEPVLSKARCSPAAVIVALALMATACGTNSSASVTAPATTAPPTIASPGSASGNLTPLGSQGPTGGPARLPALGTTIDLRSARTARAGTDDADLGTITHDGPTARFRTLAMTPGGEAFGVIGNPDSDTASGEVPALLDPRTSTFTRFPWPASHPSPKGTILYASATDRWLVWTIAVAPDLDQTPWQLFSYDRRRHITHYLGAAAPTLDGNYPTAPGYSVPSIDSHGNVYIAAVVQGRLGQPPADIVEKAPADGSAPLERYLDNAITPSVWENDLVWATRSEEHLQFWHRDLVTGVTTKLYDGTGTDCNSEFGLATAGHRTAWLLQCTHHGGDIVQVVTPGKPTLSIRGTDLGYLELTAGYVSVAPELADGTYEQIVYNLTNDRLLRVGEGPVLGDTPGNGSILTWGSTTIGHPREVTTHIIRLLTDTRPEIRPTPPPTAKTNASKRP